MSAEDHAIGDAYTRGVNAVLDDIRGKGSFARLPLELLILGHTPQPWTVADSVGLARFYSFQLSRGWAYELFMRRFENEVRELAQELVPRHDARVPFVNEYGARPALFDQNGQPMSLPEYPQIAEWATLPFHSLIADLEAAAGGKAAPSPPPAAGKVDTAHLDGMNIGLGDGSNGYAVSGKHTASGKPMLSGDPHLAALRPGFWYPNAVKMGSQWTFVGASAMGIPGWFAGTNRHLAFTPTVSYMDSEDAFEISLGTGQHNGSYLYAGKYLPIRSKTVELNVKGRQEPQQLQLRYTHHGPLVSDALPELVNITQLDSATRAIALRSGSLLSPFSVSCMRDLATAKTWRELDKAMQELKVTQLTMAFATVDGDIGAITSGDLPKRSRPASLRDGSDPQDEWTGVVPHSQLPGQVVNPEKGYVVIANHFTAANATDVLGFGQLNGYRAAAIERRLKPLLGKVTVDDLRAIFTDVWTLGGHSWRKMANNLLAEGPSPCFPYVREDVLPKARELLAKWNEEMSSPAATVYTVWKAAATSRLLVSSGMSAESVAFFRGAFPNRLLIQANELFTHDKHTLLRLLDGESASGLVSKAGGRESVLCGALNESWAFLESQYGNDVAAWAWENVHAFPSTHAFYPLPLLRHIFSGPPQPGYGDEDTAAPAKASIKYEESSLKDEFGRPVDRASRFVGGVFTPSLRMAIDLGNISSSRWALPASVSGWIGNSFQDIGEAFQQGQLVQMPFEPSSFEPAETFTLGS